MTSVKLVDPSILQNSALDRDAQWSRKIAKPSPFRDVWTNPSDGPSIQFRKFEEQGPLEISVPGIARRDGVGPLQLVGDSRLTGMRMRVMSFTARRVGDEAASEAQTIARERYLAFERNLDEYRASFMSDGDALLKAIMAVSDTADATVGISITGQDVELAALDRLQFDLYDVGLELVDEAQRFITSSSGRGIRMRGAFEMELSHISRHIALQMEHLERFLKVDVEEDPMVIIDHESETRSFRIADAVNSSVAPLGPTGTLSGAGNFVPQVVSSAVLMVSALPVLTKLFC